MRLVTYKLANPKPELAYTLVVIVASLLYIALFAAGFQILDRSNNLQTGQLASDEAVSGESFSRNLDLRVATKNSYPSGPLTLVKNLGTSGGVKEQIISFGVPADGLTEYGLMMMPADTASGQTLPSIILCHGYANPARYLTTANYLEDMTFYAQHGFVVVKPDYRGQGLSQQQGEADSAYYSMAYNTDVMSLISALKQTKYIDKSNINLWGHSMGAYIALRAAVLSPDIKNVILLSGAVDSLSKMYLTYIPPSDENNLNALKTRQEVFSKYGTPAENNAFWKDASPINFISRIKAHIQIDVGALDQVVPPEFSADLDTAFNKNHIKHDYYVYQGGLHNLLDFRQQIWSNSLKVLTPSTNPPTNAGV